MMLFHTDWSPIDKVIRSHHATVADLQHRCAGELAAMNDRDGLAPDLHVGAWLEVPGPVHPTASTTPEPSPSLIGEVVSLDKNTPKVIMETRGGQPVTVANGTATRVTILGRVSQWREQATYLLQSLAENVRLQRTLRAQIRRPRRLLWRQRAQWLLQAMAVGGLLLGYGLLWPPITAVRLLLRLLRVSLAFTVLAARTVCELIAGLGEELAESWQWIVQFRPGRRQRGRPKHTRRR